MPSSTSCWLEHGFARYPLGSVVSSVSTGSLDPMRMTQTAMNRTSRSGQVIGPEQRATPYLALKGVTSYAAYQIKEENSKGTLEPGKLADLVILEQNPLKVDPKTIKDIKVLETIKEGQTVYERK